MNISIVTSAGTLEVPAIHIWSQEIMGTPFRFALHATGSGSKGFERRLAVSELSTGFDIKVRMLHPKSRLELTVNSSAGVKRNELKKIARAATHNLLRTIGPGTFVKAILDARLSLVMRSAKVQEFATAGIEAEPTGAGIDLSDPVSGTITGRATPEQAEFLGKLMATCETCNGSQVVSTTDIDHEGNNIETTCPACISKAVELAETPVSEMGVVLEGLKLRLSTLNNVAAQHGTMTGDTTEQDYEDLAYNICDLEMQIAELEKTNAPTE